MSSYTQKANISFDRSSPSSLRSINDTSTTTGRIPKPTARLQASPGRIGLAREASLSGAEPPAGRATKRQTSKSDGEQASKQQQVVKFTSSTLFLSACANGDLDECKRLLDEQQIDIDTTTCDGLTGLHEAAICGHEQLLIYLLERGANIDCRDNEGWTPLHAAASLGQARIVELLLERNADATLINCENFLAYDLARNDTCRELIGKRLEGQDIEWLRSQEERLIEHDIEQWIATGQYCERSHAATGATVLHVLAAKGLLELMRRMLETPKLKRQLNLEAQDNEGYTPLLAASFWNQAEVVHLLIEHGANIFAQANDGYKISSIHLKNYQQSKLQQPSPILASSRDGATSSRTNRASLQSLDSELNSSSSSPLNNSIKRSSTSLDNSSDNEPNHELAQIPNSGQRESNQVTTRSQAALIKSKSVELGTSQTDKQTYSELPSMLTSSMSADRLLVRVESMGERDLRKSFKELVMENERLKQQVKGFDENEKQKQQEWIRKERQLQRKISELEEENKQIDQWKQEIQRLKEENSSLIRVVSKLSKH